MNLPWSLLTLKTSPNPDLLPGVVTGVLAGAAGATAANAVTYVDMAVRGRDASNSPAKTVKALAAEVGVTIPGEKKVRRNRLEGLGALAGIGTGVLVGAAYGLAHGGHGDPSRMRWLVGAAVTGAGAMAFSDATMTWLGITSPAAWSTTDWLSDALPHLAYGLVTASCVELVTGRGSSLP